jgi:hypothetical protein
VGPRLVDAVELLEIPRDIFERRVRSYRIRVARTTAAPVAGRMVMGGSWSAYWHNGVIVSSEIARGLDIYELVTSPLISENELAAAKTVRMPYWNTQDQQKLKWPQTFVLARAYLDQLEHSKGLPADRIKSARSTLASAERRSERDRKAPLTQLASQLNAAAGSSSDAAKVRMLASTVADLAGAQ